MNSTWRDINFSGNFINGRFIIPDRESFTFEKYNPADLNDFIVGVPVAYSHADDAVEKASIAFNLWSKLEDSIRIEYFEKLRNSLEILAPWFVELISRELGRPIWDAKQEVETTIFDISELYNQYLGYTPYITEDINLYSDPVEYYKPSGVVAVIAPYNQPFLYSMRAIITALLTGNTVVYKPSLLTPMTGQLISELVQSAELPNGVFNMVHGSIEVAKRFIVNRKVTSVFFYGNFETGSKISKHAKDDYAKLMIMSTGGRNAAIIMEDADIDLAVNETIVGAFISSGQRCNNTRRIYVHNSIKETFISKFHDKAKKLKIAHPHDEYLKDFIFMGPLGSENLMQNYLRLQGIGLREGADILMRGKEIAVNGKYKGYYVTPSINLSDNLNEKGVYNSSEILGPNVSIRGFSNIDELMLSHNTCNYGLGISIFSEAQKNLNEIIQKADVGLVFINTNSFGESVMHPVVGYGKSGNLHPEGCLSIRYLRKPVVIYKKEFIKKQKFNNLLFEEIKRL